MFSCSSAQDKSTFQLTLKQVKNSQHGDKWKCITENTESADTSIYVNGKDGMNKKVIRIRIYMVKS